MECNKDEAIRAKAVSEKMYLEMDIDGAMKFALKAQELYPDLDGLSQLLATLDVSLAAQRRVNGEVDWYAVLDVEPSADVESMRKCYRKLALLLHPDKNKSIGADGAFKLISEAWSLLSDKDKRDAYDEKRNLSIDEKIPDEEPSVPATEPVFYDFFGSSQGDAHPNSTPMSPVSLKESFWTVCSACSTIFEHSIIYVNCIIRCPRCLQPFLAFELDNSYPNTNASFTSTVPQVQGQNFNSSQMGQTFWTICNSCMTRFEYSIIYINQKIRCYRCHQPFLTFEEHSSYAHKSASFASTTSQVQGQKLDSSPMEQTFRTSCSSCTTQFKYTETYINQKLKCHRCGQPLMAFETNLSYTHTDALSTLLISQMQGLAFNSSHMERNSEELPASNLSQKNLGSFPSFMKGGMHKNLLTAVISHMQVEQFNSNQMKINSSVSGGAPASATNLSSSVPTSASSVAEAPGDLELPSGCKDTPPFFTQEEAHNHAVKTTGDVSISYSSCFGSSTSLEVDRLAKKRCMDVPRDVKAEGDTETGMSSQYEGMRLVDKSGSCSTGHLHNNETMTSEEANFDHSKINDKEATMRDVDVVEPGEEGSQEFTDSKTLGKDHTKMSLVNSFSKGIGIRCMEVPDPDFYNFDNERTAESFGVKQVWAAYDEDDAMPRFYALIHSVLSRHPFEVKFSWLNTRRNGELAPFKWVKSGYYKTVGNFRIGRYLTTDCLKSFSHRVDRWTKGRRGTIQIYPKKGDVWALFSNWSLKWNIFTTDEVIHKYDMVEVLEDYDKVRGVIVAPLIKVPKFNTVFRRYGDPGKIMNIPKKEMFRFSHRVPSHILSDEEGLNAPRGCIELDPASLPEELYKRLTEKEVEIAFGGTSDVGLGPRENPREAELLERSPTNGEHAVADIARQTEADAVRKKSNRDENLIVYRRKRFRDTRKPLS